MRILGRYIFREILASAIIGTILATFVIFLQKVGALFEVMVRSSASSETVLQLFLLALPPVLPMTIPFGVLVGILIGLGRLSSDGEITALRAAGVSSRRVIWPVMTFAVLATSVAGACSLRWTPWAIRQSYAIVNRLFAAQLTAEIQPRIFEEQFPNTILYVGDVKPGPVTLWRDVFLADLTPPEQRPTGLREKAEGPRITVAREAIAIADPAHNRVQLSLKDASTHEIGRDGVGDHSSFPRGDQALEASPPRQEHARAFTEMNTGELSRYPREGPDSIEARIELHRRFALPLACIILALVGIPLGISSRKGGKSGGYVTAVFLAFFCYHLAFISLIGLAKQRAIPVPLAVWTPNASFLLAGILLLLRLERPGDRDLVGALKSIAAGLALRIRPAAWVPQLSLNPERQRGPLARNLPLLPQLVDTYILSKFLFYFLLLLSSFVMMTQVYTFFELLSDMVRNKIPMARMLTYLLFLTPKLIYDTLPVGVLVAVLVTFGVLTKQNEVTAFKACGVSLYRLAVPVLLLSVALSAGLFGFDYYYIPEANRIQDSIRNEIKGRPVQTYLRPDRKWIFGSGPRIYYYKYLDPNDNVMAGVNVYELEPQHFNLVRQIAAERAQWQPSLKTWIFENGWIRDIREPGDWSHGGAESKLERFQVRTFGELNEPPSYFLKEVKQDKQMNFRELGTYIADLQQSGFDTVRLRVQLHKKFSVPLFALIMAMISIPFGFLVGNRGAMAGIGISIGVAIAYWGIGQLFEQIGNVNGLPPAVAAWSPDAVFSLAGLYLLLRMRS
jgi:LPS export ABC transporter permease LptG/LPS export ABC transporter permease LptF